MQAVSVQEALNSLSSTPVATGDAGEVFSIEGTRSRVAHLAKQLDDSSTTALLCENSFNFLVGFLALASRNIPTIIVPSQTALEELKSKGQVSLLSDIAQLSPNYLVGTQAKSGPSASLGISSQWEFSLFTSGSSGKPKQVMKTLSLLEREIAELESSFGKQLENRTICGTVSHQHIYGILFRLLWPFCTGRTFHAPLIRYPEQLESWKASPISLVSSPSFLKRIPADRLSSTFEGTYPIFSSGGALPEQSAIALGNTLECFPIEVLGSTETGGIAYRGGKIKRYQAVWTSFPSVRTDCQQSHSSRLRIHSPYIHHSLLEGDGSYLSDDRIEALCDNTFLLLGRADRIVKVEEKRVSLSEVEAKLSELDEVADVGVMSFQKKLPSGNRRITLGAVIKTTSQGALTLKKIGHSKFSKLMQTQLRSTLEPLAIPRYFRFVKDIPENSEGKRTQECLETLFDDSQETSQTIVVAPDMEQLTGHFPGMPIIAGFLQLNWIADACQEKFPGKTIQKISSVRYVNPILPKEQTPIHITLTPKKASIHFTISSDTCLHTKGSLHLVSGLS